MVLQNSVDNYLLSLPGGICLPSVKYPRANINSSASGNNDVYTVPAGRRTIVLTSTLRSGSGSTATIVQNWKISGTYYTTTFSAISLTAGTVLNDTNDGGFIMEAGESISFNSNQTAINMYVQLIEFDSAASLKTVKTIGATNGDQTIYTCPSGKMAAIMSGNGQIWGMTNRGLFISNNSGGSITSNIYIVPNGNSKGANNLFQGSIATSNGLCSRINCAAILSPGDFIVWNCNTTNANALCAATILEI
jgi:hypothetical protein